MALRLRAVVTPQPSGDCDLYPGGGGGQAKKVCVPKINVQFGAPLINFIYFLRKTFLMWVGGG